MAIRKQLASAADRTPTWFRGGLKAVIVAWGRATSRWRVLPDVVVVGAQRTGTTTLFRLLSEHPGVERPVVRKGVGYFDLNYERGTAWYRAHFPLRATLRLRARAGRRPLVFESSGYYLFHPLSAGRIARDLPGVKVVALIRDPVERAYSAHRHELARGFEDLDFETALRHEQKRLGGEAQRLVADPTAHSYEHRHHGYLARSQYAEQLRRYIELLGRDRVYVMEADRFFSDPVGEFRLLQQWLGITVTDPDDVSAWNARPGAPLDPALRRELMTHFEPHDRELAQILGHEPSWRSET